MPNFRIHPRSILLAEGKGAPEMVQILRTGRFHHPDYGVFEITKETLESFKKNFDSKVRGVDLALDYAHDSDREAAAWFTEVILQNGNQELWVKLDWTPAGKSRVESKEFRYLSADFTYDYEDNESKEKFGPTLLGAGLTNRPFVKEMAPAVELTEEKTKGNTMTLDEALKENKRLSDELAKSQEEKKKLEDEMGGQTPEQMKARIAELEAEVAKLKGANEAAEKKAAEDKACAEKKAAEDKACAEKKEKFDVMLKEGKVVEAQRDSWMKNDMESFAKLSEKPNLNPSGSGEEDKSGGKGGKTDAQDEIIALAEKLVADKKASDIVTAQRMVLADPKHADLKARYKKETAV